jgi:hypothetical protein
MEADEERIVLVRTGDTKTVMRPSIKDSMFGIEF